MFRATLSLIGAAVVGLATSQANAHDWYFYYGPSRGYYSRHDRVHEDLARRSFDRELEHCAAHRAGVTPAEHEALHDALDTEAYVDSRDHARWHTYNRPVYYGRGFYFGGGRARVYFYGF